MVINRLINVFKNEKIQVNNEFCIFTNDNNIIIKTDLNSKHIHSSLFYDRDNHEIMFRRLITYLINEIIIDKSKNFIDLGAWIGDNALPWSKNITGLIYAIDPSPENCKFIRKLIKLNDVQNIEIIEKAISNKKEFLSTNQDLEHCWLQEGIKFKNKVESTTLDELLKEGIITNIEFIHLDVEGMEKKVIKGSINLIKKFKPIIAFEQHIEREDYNSIVAILTGLDYKTLLINEILPGCYIDCRNFLSFPDEKYNESLFTSLNKYISNNKDKIKKGETRANYLIKVF